MWSIGPAAALAAFAVALWLRAPPGRRTARRLRAASCGRPLSRVVWRSPATRPVGALVVCGVACGAAWWALDGRAHLVVLTVVAIFVGRAVLALRTRNRLAERRRRMQAELTELCDVLAAELEAGAPPAIALEHCARDWPVVEPVATAARLGGDVPQSLRAAATAPGCAALAQIAAAWEVSTRSGAALSGTLTRISQTLRDDAETRREVSAALGSPRATARLLAVLPLLGLALGSGMGGDPWAVLVGSLFGAGCLALGAALAVGGVFWVERIAELAETGR